MAKDCLQSKTLWTVADSSVVRVCLGFLASSGNLSLRNALLLSEVSLRLLSSSVLPEYWGLWSLYFLNIMLKGKLHSFKLMKLSKVQHYSDFLIGGFGCTYIRVQRWKDRESSFHSLLALLSGGAVEWMNLSLQHYCMLLFSQTAVTQGPILGEWEEARTLVLRCCVLF